MFDHAGTVSTMGYQSYMIDREVASDVERALSPRPDWLLCFLYLLPPFSFNWALVKVFQLEGENQLCISGTASDLYDTCAFVRNSADDIVVLLTGLRYCCATFFEQSKLNKTVQSVSTLSALSFHR